MKHKLRTLHFTGIGGVGMSGIAELLLNLGYQVSGSDIAVNQITNRLKKLGAKIYQNHHIKNVKDIDALVASSAISVDNPEIRSARERGIPVVSRALMLSELMRMKKSIAIAGTHGKTTSTSFVSAILGEAGLDPTYVIGGKLKAAGVNAKLGKGEYIVVEADESDRSFLNLYPMITMVTNINHDHLENYNHDFIELKKAFIEFITHLPFYGLAVVCIDDIGIRNILPFISRPIITYGLDTKADYRAVNIKTKGRQMLYRLIRKKNKPIDIVLNHPGMHNVINSLGAIAVADEIGINDDFIISALAKFKGVGRRIEELGYIKTKDQGKALIVEDYGHHPREIDVTTEAINKAYPKNNIILVFQPHRFSRTRDCFYDFVKVFAKQKKLILTEIYSAGEKIIPSATSENLIKTLIKKYKVNKKNHYLVANVENIPTEIKKIAKADDIFLVMGAGSIGGIMRNFIKKQG